MQNADIIRAGVAYIERHLKTDITPEELARMAGYSVWHYQRLFAQAIGVPLAVYIKRRRLDHALEEIGAGRKAVDVALEYGFDTYAGFYKAFMNMYGCSPKKYLSLYGTHQSKSEVSFMYREKELREILTNWDISQEQAISSVKVVAYDKFPEMGYITLNGVNIEELDRDAYLKLFSVVFQDFKIFAFPVGENVAASTEYDENRVWQSLNLAGLDEKIRGLPKQLNQYVYKNVDVEGTEFSGGEEQKLAIARAFYKDAPVYIFDEPTAALDPMAEAEVYARFNHIVGDRTALFISHRLSSCRFCERILVFDQGRIVQSGKHEELLQNISGKYCELWNAQAQYYV